MKVIFKMKVLQQKKENDSIGTRSNWAPQIFDNYNNYIRIIAKCATIIVKNCNS